jgi:hypothetical protein
MNWILPEARLLRRERPISITLDLRVHGSAPGLADITFARRVLAGRMEPSQKGFHQSSSVRWSQLPVAVASLWSRWQPTSRSRSRPCIGGCARPTSTTDLDADACLGAGSCVAVGTEAVSIDTSAPVIETFSGGAWTAVNVPLPSGDSYGELCAIACPVIGSCVAAGYDPPSAKAHLPSRRSRAAPRRPSRSHSHRGIGMQISKVGQVRRSQADLQSRSLAYPRGAVSPHRPGSEEGAPLPEA